MGRPKKRIPKYHDFWFDFIKEEEKIELDKIYKKIKEIRAEIKAIRKKQLPFYNKMWYYKSRYNNDWRNYKTLWEVVEFENLDKLAFSKKKILAGYFLEIKTIRLRCKNRLTRLQKRLKKETEKIPHS